MVLFILNVVVLLVNCDEWMTPWAKRTELKRIEGNVIVFFDNRENSVKGH